MKTTKHNVTIQKEPIQNLTCPQCCLPEQDIYFSEAKHGSGVVHIYMRAYYSQDNVFVQKPNSLL